jgi:primosomal replication protein N
LQTTDTQPVTPHLNDVTLTVSLTERKALRYTPAGMPALDLGLHHESTVVEAGQPRKVVCDLKAVAIGTVAEQLNRTDLGATLQVKGFLGMFRNGRGVLLHIQHII